MFRKGSLQDADMVLIYNTASKRKETPRLNFGADRYGRYTVGLTGQCWKEARTRLRKN